MNETKKYEVIKAVAENRKQKKRASVELNLSIRQINRLLKVYKEEGKSGFVHKNRGKTHTHAVPGEIKKQIIKSYQDFGIRPNVRHFTEILKEEHHISYSDTTIGYNDSSHSYPSLSSFTEVSAQNTKKDSKADETRRC